MQNKTHILLVGGGHANIQVLHSLAKTKNNSFKVTLVSDVTQAPYSGMIPSYLAGVYTASDLQFDLAKLCTRFGFQFIQSSLSIIHAEKNQVLLTSGEFLNYDICSINIGIESNRIQTDADDEKNIIYLKPISKLIKQWNQIKNLTDKKTAGVDLKIIGGGAAAFEIAIACRQHFKSLLNKITIISGKNGLLHDQISRVQKYAKESLKAEHIELIEGQRVEKITNQHLTLTDGSKLTKDICFIGTTAATNPIFVNSSLPVNLDGFVRVNENLLIEGYPNIFASGDCSYFTKSPLAKAGVYAVRQGPIIFKNIMSIMASKPLDKYLPQTEFLKILVCGNKNAIVIYGKFVFRGYIAWQLKNYIDRKFMERFQ